MSATPLLAIEELRVEFGPRETPTVAIDGLSLHIERGETLVLVSDLPLPDSR